MTPTNSRRNYKQATKPLPGVKGRWGGGGGGEASEGGGAFAAGCLNTHLAAALSRVVPIPAVAAASVLHSAAVVGFDAGVVGAL